MAVLGEPEAHLTTNRGLQVMAITDRKEMGAVAQQEVEERVPVTVVIIAMQNVQIRAEPMQQTRAAMTVRLLIQRVCMAERHQTQNLLWAIMCPVIKVLMAATEEQVAVAVAVAVVAAGKAGFIVIVLFAHAQPFALPATTEIAAAGAARVVEAEKVVVVAMAGAVLSRFIKVVLQGLCPIYIC